MRLLTWAVATVVIFGVIGFMTSQSMGTRSGCAATLPEFLALTTGASYADAILAIGCPGIEMSRTEIGDTKAVMYQWAGTTTVGNMNAMFQNDTLVSKAQFGLQ